MHLTRHQFSHSSQAWLPDVTKSSLSQRVLVLPSLPVMPVNTASPAGISCIRRLQRPLLFIPGMESPLQELPIPGLIPQ